MIAFDIDGCANSIKEDIMTLGKDFFPQSAAHFNPGGYYLREIYPGFEEKLYQEFWEKFGYTIYTNPPKKHVYETISFLKQNNIDCCYITTRDVEKKFDGVTLKEITEDWLDKYDIKLPVYYEKDKQKTVQRLHVKLMVEDKPDNIIKISPFAKVLIYKHPYNQHLQGRFVENWYEIYEFLKITLLYNQISE